MKYVLELAAIAATIRPTALPLLRGALRDLLLVIAARAASVAARLESIEATPRPTAAACWRQPRVSAVRLIEAAATLAIAAYYAAGLIAVLVD